VGKKENQKRWRERHPEYSQKWKKQHQEAIRQWRTRNRDKQKTYNQLYYAKNQDDPESTRNASQRWTDHEDALITAAVRPPDSILAKQIGRTIRAIHVRRARIKK
jgi:hypothetical protein